MATMSIKFPGNKNWRKFAKKAEMRRRKMEKKFLGKFSQNFQMRRRWK